MRVHKNHRKMVISLVYLAMFQCVLFGCKCPLQQHLFTDSKIPNELLRGGLPLVLAFPLCRRWTAERSMHVPGPVEATKARLSEHQNLFKMVDSTEQPNKINKLIVHLSDTTCRTQKEARKKRMQLQGGETSWPEKKHCDYAPGKKRKRLWLAEENEIVTSHKKKSIKAEKGRKGATAKGRKSNKTEEGDKFTEGQVFGGIGHIIPKMVHLCDHLHQRPSHQPHKSQDREAWGHQSVDSHDALKKNSAMIKRGLNIVRGWTRAHIARFFCQCALPLRG